MALARQGKSAKSGILPRALGTCKSVGGGVCLKL